MKSVFRRHQKLWCKSSRQLAKEFLCSKFHISVYDCGNHTLVFDNILHPYEDLLPVSFIIQNVPVVGQILSQFKKGCFVRKEGCTTIQYCVHKAKCCDRIIVIANDKRKPSRQIAFFRVLLTRIALANVLTPDPSSYHPSAKLMADQFAKNGLFASPFGPVIPNPSQTARQAIVQAVLAYYRSMVDLNGSQEIVVRTFSFDDATKSGNIQDLFQAIAGPNTSGIGPPCFPGPAPINPGNLYQEDDSVVFALDGCGFLRYFREYYWPNQSVSNFRPAPPSKCGELFPCGKCV